MTSYKLNFLILSYAFLIRSYFVTADNHYEVIKFKVPHAVWKQALHPTPILKSPVTIVLPINVPDGENLVDEDIEDETENVEVDATFVNEEEAIPEVVPAAQDVIVNAPETVANLTEVLQDEDNVQPPSLQDVPGQVVRFPCSCLSGQCGCCTGAILERFSMKACGNMTFIPEDFVFDVRMTVNNNTVVRQRVSGHLKKCTVTKHCCARTGTQQCEHQCLAAEIASDPPPICFNPRRAPFVRVCAEISNIRIRNRNAHACLDINADIGGFPIYSTSFKCFSLGSSGIKTGQKPKPPSSGGPKPINLFGNGGQEEGGFLQNAAESVLGQGNNILGGGNGGILGGGDGGILGGGDGGIFGGGGDGGIFGGGGDDGGFFGDGGDDGGDEGPLDAIGDALGDFLDRRSYS